MNILNMTLKKKWFDMIVSGEKKEEYREIKKYWSTRFNKNIDAILFRNGYKKNSPEVLIKFEGMYVGYGGVEHGAPKDYPVFILSLGDIIKTKNIV